MPLSCTPLQFCFFSNGELRHETPIGNKPKQNLRKPLSSRNATLFAFPDCLHKNVLILAFFVHYMASYLRWTSDNLVALFEMKIPS